MTITRTNVAEEEYFRRQEADRRRDDAWDTQQETSRVHRAELARLKAVELKLCPQCKTALEKRTLQGVELDQCGSCHGTWIEARQLEQLGGKKQRGILARFFGSRGGVDK